MTTTDIMNIGFIGAGKIGSALARLAVSNGYTVIVRTRETRRPLRSSLRSLAQQHPPRPPSTQPSWVT